MISILQRPAAPLTSLRLICQNRDLLHSVALARSFASGRGANPRSQSSNNTATTSEVRRSKRPGGLVSREKRQKALAAKNAAAPPPPQFAVRSVQDLEKILPNMPYEEQQRIRALIDEHGDSINESLAQSVELSSAGDSGNPREVHLNESQLTQDYKAAISVLTKMVENILEDRGEGEKVSNEAYVKLWKTVKLFSRIEKDPSVEPPLEVLVVLFQLAKEQNSSNTKKGALKLVGDLLYGYQVVRMDPYNEVEYLSALTKLRQTSKAIRIWESRRYKDDVKDSIWWLEVGTCLYQENHNLPKAEELALELKERFNHVPPKVINRFIKQYLSMGKTELAWEWYRYMIAMVKGAGGPGAPEVITGNFNPEEAEAVFNKKHIPSEMDLLFVLDLFLRNLCSSYSVVIINDLSDIGIQLSQDTILTNLENVARNIVRLEDQDLSKLASAPQKADVQELDGRENVFSNVMQTLTKTHPALLKSPRFYSIWISAHANMNNLNGALEVLDSMLSLNFSPSPHALHSVLKSLLTQKRVAFALRILECMETGGASGSLSEDNLAKFTTSKIPRPRGMHYALFIQYGARRIQHSFVLGILKRMAENGVKHDESTYLALFYYRYRARDFIGVFQLLSEAINSSKLQFSSEGYRVIWTIVRDYYRSPPSVIRRDNLSLDLRSLFIRMLQSKDFTPLLEVYEPALQAFLRSGKLPELFASLLYLSSHNGFKMDAMFCYRLTQTAQQIGRANKGKSTYIQSQALNAKQVSMSRLMESVAAGKEQLPEQLVKAEFTPEAQIEAICKFLDVPYNDFLPETESVLEQFQRAEHAPIAKKLGGTFSTDNSNKMLE